MTRHHAARTVKVPRSALFDIVADVERYPEFLALWKGVKVRGRQGNVYRTEQEIGIGPIRERFETRTLLMPPDVIEITSDDRLFRRFLIRWTFQDLGDTCRVEIVLDWSVRRFLLQRAIDLLLPETARSMVDAFEARALALKR